MKSAISMAPLTWWVGDMIFGFHFHFHFHLPPDGGDPVLVTQQGVHVHTVLDHQGRDRDERKHLKQKSQLKPFVYQHVENEELLTPRSGGVDLVAPHLPDRVLDVLLGKRFNCWL